MARQFRHDARLSCRPVDGLVIATRRAVPRVQREATSAPVAVLPATSVSP